MSTVKPAILGGRDRVKIAIAQISPAYLDPAASAQRAAAAIADAAGEGADLVVFPEVWLAGYPYWTEGWDSDVTDWVGGRVRWSDAAVVVGEAATEQIATAIQSGSLQGMQSMDTALKRLLDAKQIIGKDAYRKAIDKKLFEMYAEPDLAA